MQRKASSPQAQGADAKGYRHSVQLALEGVPYQKPKHTVGTDTVGLDLGPASIAIVPREAEARLEALYGAVAEVIGRDGWTLLTDLLDPAAPALLREIPAVELVRQIWVHNYYWQDDQLH